MAARRTREALSPLESVKSIYLQPGEDGAASPVNAALAAVVGFYPPGTYVRLVGGEIAVVVQRGERANTPWVLVIVDRQGMPVFGQTPLDTAEPQHAIAAPMLYRSGKVVVHVERVRRARAKIRRPTAA